MADFNVQLAEAQGRGTDPVSPVQERVADTSSMNILSQVGNIFAKGLEQNHKEAIVARRNAVVGEYINNQKVYDDALTSGQWNASQASMASRANYTKFIASHPEYAEDIQKAREAFYGGSETGEAQKKIEAERKQREADIGSASAAGFTFYPGMSEEAQNKTLDAYKYARRMEVEFQQSNARVQAGYAANAEARAAGTYTMSVDDYVQKEKAVQGARELAGANFDVVATTAEDLKKRMAAGMPYEQAIAIHSGNINRVKAGLLAIAGKNPEMAAPWTKLFDDMDANIKAQLDPKTKTADEAKILTDQYNIMLTKAKIAAVSDPKLLKAVVGSNLFQGEGMVTLSNVPVVRDWLLKATDVDPNLGKPSQVVGTVDDPKLFQTAKEAVTRLQTGNMPPDVKEKATIEAAKMINTLLDQTSKVDAKGGPAALKQASTFFASPEFGRLVLDGKVDKQTAANAQYVFQTLYQPAVQDAVVKRLENANVANQVNVRVVGNNVVFEKKVTDVGPLDALSNFSIHNGMNGLEGKEGVADLKDASSGLNQLIRLHAHLEGTTDYAKYWEDHKHQLMPSIFPDPTKLKPGQVEGGYKYIGGNYRDRSNWIAEPVKPASK